MGGWRRLGIVIGTILAVPTVLVAHESTKRISIVYTPEYVVLPEPEAPNLAPRYGEDTLRLVLREAGQSQYVLRRCENGQAVIKPGYFAREFNISCVVEPREAWVRALPYGLIPFGCLWMIGLTVGWVWRGFQPK